MKKIGIILMLILSLVLAGCSTKKPASTPESIEDYYIGGKLEESGEQKEGVNKAAVKIAAPDFEIETLNGGSIKLSDLKGKVVVLNFFATWCPPCRAEMPGFISTMEEYEKEGSDVVFLFIDVDEDDKTVKEFLDSRNYDIDPLLDKGGSIYSQYTLRGGIPTTTIVDKDGNISAQREGLMESSDLKAYIEKALE